MVLILESNNSEAIQAITAVAKALKVNFKNTAPNRILEAIQGRIEAIRKR
jgi:hypothetical protein